ncbi:hypothetical protein PLICRDRAFT_563331 [Plicaturopsis crispa FD-325 SS-3]|nr:hypothetical protein PLICRDRAFT_563331 [Plicaturopsis crispa FD-325 SS-3]
MHPTALRIRTVRVDMLRPTPIIMTQRLRNTPSHVRRNHTIHLRANHPLATPDIMKTEMSTKFLRTYVLGMSPTISARTMVKQAHITTHHRTKIMTQEHSHLPQIAAQYHQETDPALFAAATQQFHRTNAHPSRPNSVPVDEQAAYAAHEQAYGRHSGASAMDSEAMGSAAAMQALKMSAAQAQATSPSAEPASGEHEHKHTSQAPANTEANNSPPSNPQDKLIALAMAQAAKLFDKQSGGSPTGGSAASSAKTQAMHSAANIAMRMANQYRTTGKASFESGEMQGLIDYR